MQLPSISNTYAMHIPYTSHIKSNGKTKQKNIKNHVKNTQTYHQHPPKMSPKSIPGTLLGGPGENMPFIASPCVPNGRQKGCRWIPKISKILKKSTKEAPKNAPKIDT